MRFTCESISNKPEVNLIIPINFQANVTRLSPRLKKIFSLPLSHACKKALMDFPEIRRIPIINFFVYIIKARLLPKFHESDPTREWEKSGKNKYTQGNLNKVIKFMNRKPSFNAIGINKHKHGVSNFELLIMILTSIKIGEFSLWGVFFRPKKLLWKCSRLFVSLINVMIDLATDNWSGVQLKQINIIPLGGRTFSIQGTDANADA